MEPNRATAKPQTMNMDKVDTLLELERTLALRKGFWRGLLAAMLVIMIIIGASGVYVYTHQVQALEFVSQVFLQDVVEGIFRAFPDAYMTNRREFVLEVLDQFTNAVAADKVSRMEFSEIGRAIFAALRDRQLTYQEVDGVFEMMRQASTN